MQSESLATLFHIITDEESATVRKFIVDQDLMEKVNFRNIDRSEDGKKLLSKLLKGELTVPTLLVGSSLHIGKEACLRALKDLK